jgi:ribosomal protein S17E
MQAKKLIKNAVLSGYITTLKNKQKLDVSSEGATNSWRRDFARNVE